MNERCRCGAELISELSCCVTCGTPRPAHPAMASAGRHRHPVPVAGARPVGRPAAPQPTRTMPPMPPAPMGYPTPASAAPAYAAPAYAAPAYAAPAPRSSSAPWIVGAASVVVLAVLGALLVVTLRPAVVHGASPVRPATTVVTPTTVTAAPAPSSSSYDTATGSGSSSSDYTGTSGVAGTSSTSTEALNDQLSADHGAVEAVTDQWIPQLSSKRVGTVADGVTYDAGTILSHYRGLASSYPGAQLIWSGDWPVFKESDYWVVVVAQPFSTADAANSWCSSQGLGPDDCFAKKLSHSGGPEGSSKTRS